MNNPITWTRLTPEERDRLVAESVFHWKPVACSEERELTVYDDGDAWCPECHVREHISSFDHGIIPPPAYSQSMDASQRLIEAPLFMQAKDEYFTHWKNETEKVKVYTCTVHLYEPRIVDGHRFWLFSANGNAPMEARCLAALAALGIKGSDEE